MPALQTSLLELIRRAAIYLPKDVVDALGKAQAREVDGSSGKTVLDVILQNIDIACEQEQPVSPETSSIHFYVENLPGSVSREKFQEAAQAAVAEATKLGYLQSGRLDPVTEKPHKNNVGPGSPAVHFDGGVGKDFEVRLLLKGSGAENASTQYSLPDDDIAATRDLSGVRRAILDAIIKAQGNGSGPGVLGVGIGGDRASSFALAHRQLLRGLVDRNKVTALGRLEKRTLEDANSLGVGPMGFGGLGTILGVKIASESRPNSSFFVSISYSGWAFRRQGVRLSSKGDIQDWLYEEASVGPRAKKRAAMKVAKAAQKETKAAEKAAAAKKTKAKKATKKKTTTKKKATKKGSSVS